MILLQILDYGHIIQYDKDGEEAFDWKTPKQRREAEQSSR